MSRAVAKELAFALAFIVFVAMWLLSTAEGISMEREQLQDALNSAEQDYLFDHQQKKRMAEERSACPNSDAVSGIDGGIVCVPRRGKSVHQASAKQ